ncbi:hypothetical protein [Algibacter sp. L1A34]|uniref:hypothetical protein n=1 Tax=Algibacter sp. L1A34 TaxID=2686365 RepID=UPI00131A6CDB|nr:hypothetical protein [Algibacter sp. L1A34]
MRKILILILMLLVSINIFSQEDYIKLPQAKTQKPSFIFNQNIIGNEYLIKSLGTSEDEIKSKINEMSILKEVPNKELIDYYNLTEQGILFVDLKKIPESKNQSELNQFFGLKKKGKIYIDGYLLESEKYNIALICITEIEIVEPDSANGLKSRVLNIWTLPKNERYQE